MATTPLTAASNDLRGLEARLLGHRVVVDCAVLARRDTRGDTVIVAYVVTTGALSTPDAREFASADGDSLLPDVVVRVSSIPLTTSGDVDEVALAMLPAIEPSIVERYRAVLADAAGSSSVTVEWAAMDEAPIPIEQLAPSDARGVAPQRARGTTKSGMSESRAVLSHSVGAPINRGPDSPNRLTDLLTRTCREHPENRVICVEHDGEFSVSYAELRERAEHILGGLRAAGLTAGAIVIFELERNLDFIAAFWGCMLGGMVPAPITVPIGPDPTSAAAQKLMNAWELLGEPTVLTNGTLGPIILSLKDSLGLTRLKMLAVEELLRHERDERWHVGTPDDLALLLLTSGSSGKPKAVTQTHAALLAHVEGHTQAHGFTSNDVPLNWLALDHVGSIVMLHLGGVGLGAKQVHVRTDYILQDVLRWLDLIERHGATITWAPNFAFALVNDRVDDLAARPRDLSSMRFIVNGGEAVVASTARRFLARLTPYGLPATSMRPAWGMSETCSAETVSSYFTLEMTSDTDEFVEVGEPNPGFEIRIVDEQGQIVPEGTEGHMEVRGLCVTGGYLNNPEANASAFSADGWFRTGDLGWLRSGRMTITGREKGEIIVNGVNYPAHEVEAAVEDVPGVSASFAAAFAVRDPGDETDSLAIAFHSSRTSDAGLIELIRQIRQTVFDRVSVLPRYILPMAQDEIPKTAIGKIQRSALTKLFAAGELSAAVKRSEHLTRRAETIPSWFFSTTWRTRAHVNARPVGPGTTVLVVDDRAGIGERLATRASDMGATAILVDRASLRDRLEAVRSGRVIVAYGEQFDRTFDADPVSATMASVEGLVDTIRVINAARADVATELVAYDAPGQAVSAVDWAAVGQRSLIGILKSASAEHPAIVVRHVDVGPLDAASAADTLISELADTRDEAEVAYRGDARFVRRLIQRAPQQRGAGAALYGNHGFVAITGALGGMGVEIATHLLRVGSAPLLLIGRQTRETLSDANREALATLESLGTVRYAAADVSDFASLEGAVRDASAGWSQPLAGVVHLAGVYQPRQLADETLDTLRSAMKAKVHGGWNVHRILDAYPWAVLVVFSSVNGQLGGYGAGAYAAANAFLDGLVEHEIRVNSRAAFSLAWTLWDGVGMSGEHAFTESAARRGYQAVSIPRGVASFRGAVNGEAGHVLIGLDAANVQIRRFMDGAPFGERLVATVRSGDIATPSAPSDRFGMTVPVRTRVAGGDAAPGSDAAAFGNVLEQAIATVWAAVLATSTISPTENFFDIGGTSLLVATATRKMREALKREVAMTDIYRFPTVRLLAAHYDGDNSAEATELDESEARGTARRAQRLARRQREP
jgi:acyl-CoA synthetase (AMP-forming)/AMP-acid ligase II/NADP-dependent 3-hydroxy acid dehydrogenase YdfG